MSDSAEPISEDERERQNYRSSLYKAEAVRLIGEILIMKSGLDISYNVHTSKLYRPGRVGDDPGQATMLRQAYREGFREQVEMLRDLIVDELGRKGNYGNEAIFYISTEGSAQAATEAINKITDELSRLAAELNVK